MQPFTLTTLGRANFTLNLEDVCPAAHGSSESSLIKCVYRRHLSGDGANKLSTLSDLCQHCKAHPNAKLLCIYTSRARVHPSVRREHKLAPRHDVNPPNQITCNVCGLLFSAPSRMFTLTYVVIRLARFCRDVLI